MLELSSSRSDKPSGPNGVSVFPPPAFFASNVLEGAMLARASSTGLAFDEPEDDFRSADFNTSALYDTTPKICELTELL